MAGELSPLLSAIPIVTSASDRETRFPLASRPQNLRVYRVDNVSIERWVGSAWLVDFFGSSITLQSILGYPFIWNAFVNAVLDKGGSVLDNTISVVVRCPRGTITEGGVVSETSGSVSVDVYHATLAAFPTFTKISGTSPLAISSSTKYDDTTLTGWSTQVGDGDYLKFVVTSATTITRATAALTILRN